jgi:Tfp pilus assembly PilM family ATPase
MSTLLERLSLSSAAPPSAAVEIAAHRVSAVSLDTHGGRPVVAAQAAEALREGALVPSLAAQNIRDRASVVAALKRVLDQVGRPKRVGLVVPDPIAKISMVKFTQVPARQEDLNQLVRWQVRKAAPFPIEAAQVTYVPGARGDDGQEFVVSIARREAIEEFESVCAEAGVHAGLVDISTFNVINAAMASDGGAGAPAADWLLVNVASDYASIAILRGEHLVLFRSRGADAEGTLADLVHQTAMYYEDRLKGGGFSRVLLSGASATGVRQSADVDQIRRSLEERLGKTVEAVDPREAVGLTDRVTATPVFLDTLAPLVGLLLRDRPGRAA